VAYERTGVYLLKRWSREKGVDHYAVGLAGDSAGKAGYWRDVAIQLLPGGLVAEVWSAAPGWEVLGKAQDESLALQRLHLEGGARYALVGFNCEHFARHVVNGRRESRQVQGVAVLGLLAALILASR